MFRSRRSRTPQRSRTPRLSPTTPSSPAPPGTVIETATTVSSEPTLDERQKLTGRELATLDAKITEWEARLAQQRSELTAKLAEISEYSRTQRRIPEPLKRSYGHLKSRVATTESQVSKLNAKRDDVSRAADLAAFAETLDNANSIVDSMQPDLSRVGDILTTAAIQNEENAGTAQALHNAMSYGIDLIDDKDVELEIELFVQEQTGSMPTSQVTTPTQELDGFTEDIIAEADT